MSRMRRAALVAGSLALAGCPSKPATPTNPITPTTVVITSAGVNPARVEVALGARVVFVNNDLRPHNMSSDPHPDHVDCPEINFVGYLLAGQSRETGNLVDAGTCGFHDHDNPDNQALRGSITIK